jgi:adenine/guanine phosphoribosyltransferase-like PRPP-binding protein
MSKDTLQQSEVPTYHAIFFQNISNPEKFFKSRYTETLPIVLQSVHSQQKHVLELPIKILPGGKQAIGLFMANQTDFSVRDPIIDLLRENVTEWNVEAVIGIPTQGLTLAENLARKLGLPNEVSLTNSQKFWQDLSLSKPVQSITSKNSKSLYLDQALVSRTKGKRVVIVDSVIDTGGTMSVAIDLIKLAQPLEIFVAVVITEGEKWKDTLNLANFDWQNKLLGLGHGPILELNSDGSWSSSIHAN